MKYEIFDNRFEITDFDEKEALTGVQLLIATFRHLRNPFQLLLIPLTMWSGFEQGFFGADFTAVSYYCKFVNMIDFKSNNCHA